MKKVVLFLFIAISCFVLSYSTLSVYASDTLVDEGNLDTMASNDEFVFEGKTYLIENYMKPLDAGGAYGKNMIRLNADNVAITGDDPIVSIIIL